MHGRRHAPLEGEPRDDAQVRSVQNQQSAELALARSVHDRRDDDAVVLAGRVGVARITRDEVSSLTNVDPSLNVATLSPLHWSNLTMAMEPKTPVPSA